MGGPVDESLTMTFGDLVNYVDSNLITKKSSGTAKHTISVIQVLRDVYTFEPKFRAIVNRMIEMLDWQLRNLCVCKTNVVNGKVEGNENHRVNFVCKNGIVITLEYFPRIVGTLIEFSCGVA